jgi:hypothetical protein
MALMVTGTMSGAARRSIAYRVLSSCPLNRAKFMRHNRPEKKIQPWTSEAVGRTEICG